MSRFSQRLISWPHGRRVWHRISVRSSNTQSEPACWQRSGIVPAAKYEVLPRSLSLTAVEVLRREFRQHTYLQRILGLVAVKRPYIKQHLACRDAQRNWPIPFWPRIQRSVLVSVPESKGDYKIRRLGPVKLQGARSVVTPLPEVHDLGRLHPC